ncbi:MAG: CHAT domain-containing protein, partial [Steroidobacteraceae bacterium]
WRVAAWITAVAPLLLAACSRAPAVRVILAEQCMGIGGARQSMQIALRSPGAGLLSVEVRERGISVVAALDGGGAPTHDGDGTPAHRLSSPAQEAASPIDRLGTITLVKDVVRGQSAAARVESVDSRNMTGSVCLSARLLPSGSVRARAERLLAEADQATRRRDWQSAFDAYLEAARLLDRLNLRAAAAAARHAMAELAYGYMQRGRDGIALIGTTLTSGVAREPAILGARLVLLADALMYRPDAADAQIHRARELLQAAARAFRTTPLGQRELPRLSILAGFLAYRDGRLDRADQLFDAAAKDCKALGDWECFARARQNFAVLAEQQQNYPAALNAFEQALSPLDTTRMPLLAADISSNLARLEGQIGLFRRSAQAQERAMRLYAGLGQCDRARRSASSLGGMLVQVGSVTNAVDYLKQAAILDCPGLLAALRGPDASGTPFTDEKVAADAGTDDFGIGWTGQPADPGSICERPTFAGSTQIDRIAVFQALLDLSTVAKDDNRLSAASHCLTAARRYSFDDGTRVRLLNASGELALAQREPRAAQREFYRALRLARSRALAQSTEYQSVTEIDLAEAALGLGESADAWQHANSALQLSSARADVTQVVASLRLLALSDAASNRGALATRTLQAAIGLIEQVPTGELDATQRALYLATQYSTFADLTDLLVGPDDTSGASAWSAFAVAEQGHARSLRYAMMQAAREQAAAPLQADSGNYNALLRTLAASAGRESGGRSTGLLERITQLALPQTKIASPVDRTALATELQRLRATLVEYVVGRNDMLAFVTDGTAMHVFRLGSVSQIAAAAAALSERLQAPEQVPLEIRAAARDLARLILWPIRSELSRKHIIFVPDGTLYRIPLDVLPWTSSDSSTLVLQHAEISEEPSALMLTQRPVMAARPAGPEHVVLIGDPVLRDNVWYRTCDGHDAEEPAAGIPQAVRTAFAWSRLLPTLPGTRAEVLAVSHIVLQSHPSASVETLLGCAATPRALREAAPTATVMHIATHGLVDARRPRLSALALTPDPPSADDAAFRLPDILRLSLHARLVALSACDTSRGRVLPGEGVLGLAQAFLQAGAQSVVASYWRVQDAATVQFMESFYRHLFVDRLPVAAALRRTQLELAARGVTYNWAAFGVYGRPDIRP